MSNSKSVKKYNFLYRTTRISDGKFYIGVHSTDVLDDGYLGSGDLLKLAINKYTRETGNHKSHGFSHEILRFYDTEIEAYTIERLIINDDFRKRDDNFNLAIGGRGGWEKYNSTNPTSVLCGHTYVYDPDINKNILISVDDQRYITGQLKSIHYNTIMVVDDYGRTSRVSLNDFRYIAGELKPIRYGVKLSDDTKNKISESLKGNIVSEYTKRKLSEAHIGDNHMRSYPIRVINIITKLDEISTCLSSYCRDNDLSLGTLFHTIKQCKPITKGVHVGYMILDINDNRTIDELLFEYATHKIYDHDTMIGYSINLQTTANELGISRMAFRSKLLHPNTNKRYTHIKIN